VGNKHPLDSSGDIREDSPLHVWGGYGSKKRGRLDSTSGRKRLRIGESCEVGGDLASQVVHSWLGIRHNRGRRRGDGKHDNTRKGEYGLSVREK
jgi:hypothetical protein